MLPAVPHLPGERHISDWMGKLRIISRLTAAALIVLLFAGGGRAAEDYLVGEGDVLKITVYDHADLNMEVRVSGGGVISFPLIGEVRVGGLTVSRVEDIISSRLADGYIIDPQLTVFIKEFRSKRTTIMGEVKNPGLYELHGRTSFLELLSKAGGLTPQAGDRATIKRKGGPGNEGGVITVDLKKLVREGNTALDVIIADGDSVYVSEAGVFFIRGEVRRPASYRLEGDISAIKAITLAGGFTDEAARDRVTIMRASGGERGTPARRRGGCLVRHPDKERGHRLRSQGRSILRHRRGEEGRLLHLREWAPPS